VLNFLIDITRLVKIIDKLIMKRVKKLVILPAFHFFQASETCYKKTAK